MPAFLQIKFFIYFDLDHQELFDKVGSLSLAESPKRFEERTFSFNCIVSTFQATLCKPLIMYVSNSVMRFAIKIC